jgi:hypothetical protein
VYRVHYGQTVSINIWGNWSQRVYQVQLDATCVPGKLCANSQQPPPPMCAAWIMPTSFAPSPIASVMRPLSST